MQELGDTLLGRWPKVALNTLTVTVVAYFLASASLLLFVEPKLPSSRDGAGKVVETVAKISVPPLKFFSPIWDRNAFKAAMPKPKATPKPKPETIDQLKVAKLNARLLGTMYSDVPVFSRAVTLVGNNQSLVKIGDEIDGFTITEIKRRAVVLQKGKNRQLLLIDSNDKRVAAKKGESRKMLSRSELKAKLQDLDSLARDIQLAPATRGKQQGLWVRQLRAGSLFSKAGLQRDDVILTVGGQQVAKGANPVALFKLLDREQVTVDILRDGKPMQLVLLLTGK